MKFLEDKKNDNALMSFLFIVLKGGLMILPLVVIIAIFKIILGFIVKLLTPISLLLSGGHQPSYVLHLVSFIILLLLLFFLGLVLSHRYGSLYFAVIERKYLVKIPFYFTIKETIQQFTGQKDMPFKHVVLVDIYGSGTRMTGFVTQNTEDQYFTVFVPTAPNPMNGNIYHVPRELVTFVDIKPETAMRTIISLGSGSDILLKSQKDSPYPSSEKEDIF